MDNGTEKLIITREVAQTVVNYLADRPYREVAQLVQAMLVLPAAEAEMQKRYDEGYAEGLADEQEHSAEFDLAVQRATITNGASPPSPET